MNMRNTQMCISLSGIPPEMKDFWKRLPLSTRLPRLSIFTKKGSAGWQKCWRKILTTLPRTSHHGCAPTAAISMKGSRRPKYALYAAMTRGTLSRWSWRAIKSENAFPPYVLFSLQTAGQPPESDCSGGCLFLLTRMMLSSIFPFSSRLIFSSSIAPDTV